MKHMKWELWKDVDGKEMYIISHKIGDLGRKTLSVGAKVIWYCDVESAYEAQVKYLEFKGFRFIRFWWWLRYKKRELDESKRTYKEMGWED